MGILFLILKVTTIYIKYFLIYIHGELFMIMTSYNISLCGNINYKVKHIF